MARMLSFPRTFLALVAILFTSSTAGAQGVGFWGGGTVDPEQFFVGSFFETPALAETIHVRPGVDGAFGGGQKTASINIDIIYKTDTAGGWQFYTGGGPSIQIVNFDDPLENTDDPGEERDISGGIVGLLGFVHESGFFAEFKFGGTGSGPNLKFGAGFRFGGTP
jgi:hypothetical protein